MIDISRLCVPVLLVLVLLGSESRAQSARRCGPAPTSAHAVAFGDARFAIEERCDRMLTPEEQIYAAGMARHLLANCQLPRDAESRAVVERFTSSIMLVVSYVGGSGTGLGESLSHQAAGAAALAEGASAAGSVRCDGPDAALLSRGIVVYLQRTATSSRFVAGCVAHYGGRYNESQCRCAAESLRAALPDVHQRAFDPEIIGRTIERYPFIAVPVLRCGVGTY